ncbi:helix-turn-helix transcriptional regulator [Pontibacter sp. CAU 1760]
MRITSKVNMATDWICKEEVTEQYDNCTPLQEKEVLLTGEGIHTLRSYQIKTAGLLLIDTQMEFSQPVCDSFEVEGESIILGFYLEGNATAAITGLLPQDTSPPNIQYICYTPSFQATFRMPPHTRHRYFLVILSKAFYFRLLHQHNELHHAFASQVMQGSHTYLSQVPLEITAEMKLVMEQLRQCQRSASLKRLFLEAKVTELLMLQLEQWQRTRQQPSTTRLHTGDAQRFAMAKAILEDTYTNPPTIQELARQVCLNEHKLKQGFKACYTHTVHGYVVWLRMEKARQLLKRPELTIAQVAYQVGYKQAAHFTAAFKRHVGFLPSQVRG